MSALALIVSPRFNLILTSLSINVSKRQSKTPKKSTESCRRLDQRRENNLPMMFHFSVYRSDKNSSFHSIPKSYTVLLNTVIMLQVKANEVKNFLSHNSSTVPLYYILFLLFNKKMYSLLEQSQLLLIFFSDFKFYVKYQKAIKTIELLHNFELQILTIWPI